MTEPSEKITLAEYKTAYRKMKAGQEKLGFLINLTFYIIVNSILATVNLLFVPSFIWFIFPLIGWGIGLTMHYIFAVHRLDRNLRTEEAKVENLANK